MFKQGCFGKAEVFIIILLKTAGRANRFGQSGITVADQGLAKTSNGTSERKDNDSAWLG